MKGYGFFESVLLITSLVFTKLFIPKARLVRLPIKIRNKKLIDFGKGLTTGVGCRLDAFSFDEKKSKKLKFGSCVQINDYVHIAAVESVLIGNNVLIASKVFISDHNHGSYSGEIQSDPNQPPALRPIISKPVIIDDNVWLGELVCIMPGVTVGKGSIVGAHSVVTHDIPPYSIAVGSPAKVIKQYSFSTKTWEAIN